MTNGCMYNVSTESICRTKPVLKPYNVQFPTEQSKTSASKMLWNAADSFPDRLKRNLRDWHFVEAFKIGYCPTLQWETSSVEAFPRATSMVNMDRILKYFIFLEIRSNKL